VGFRELLPIHDIHQHWPVEHMLALSAAIDPPSIQVMRGSRHRLNGENRSQYGYAHNESPTRMPCRQPWWVADGAFVRT
jgi:hypothetical protein